MMNELFQKCNALSCGEWWLGKHKICEPLNHYEAIVLQMVNFCEALVTSAGQLLILHFIIAILLGKCIVKRDLFKQSLQLYLWQIDKHVPYSVT